MKIQIASDLHLDLLPKLDGNEPVIIERTDADVQVLAGDIHDGCEGIDRFLSRKAGADVIYVAGNHEYYGHVYRRKQAQIQARANEVGIHFLERSAVAIKGVRFLGATLWTDYRLFEPQYSQPLAMHDQRPPVDSDGKRRLLTCRCVGDTCAVASMAQG